MQRLLYVLLWAAYACPLFAQPGFNQVYDLGYNRNQFRTMLVDQDTIVACGIARSDVAPYPQCLLVAKFDSNGRVIDHRLICDSLGDALVIAENWTDMVITTDGGYAFTSGSVNRNEGMFVKLRHDLSTEFIQEYVDTINLVEFYNAIIELPDGYLLGGYIQSPNYQAEAFLRKVDKQGNSIWLSYYGDYALFDFFSTNSRLTDSTAAFAGGFITNDNSFQGRGPWVCVIDLNEGQVIKEWKPTNAPPWFIHYLHPISDEEWVIHGRKLVQISPFEKAQSFFAVIDTNFQILNTRTLASTKLNFLWDITTTIDNQFIGAGQINSVDPNNEPGVYGRLFKFSADPDSLWSLTPAAPPTADIPGSGNYFGGVGVLSSGNIIAGGYASAGNDVWPWLVKVTPDGCVDTLWCVATQAWEPVELQLKTPDVKVWPNPALDRLFFELPESKQRVQIDLVSVDGRMARRAVCSGSGSLEVSGLPAGVYLCRFTGTEGRVQYQRIVITTL